ncbi:MAG: hypothetical protein KGZ35_09180 [Truepera sp.]|nr:hypothetical protein [Truepera sp.]
MRKLLALITVILLSLSVAKAQDLAGSWVGVSGGFPGFNLHFGLNDAISQGIDLRLNGSFTYTGAFGLGADVLVAIPAELDQPIAVYGGGGPYATFGGAAGFGFGLALFVGGEYRLGDIGFAPGGIFAELGPSLGFAPSFGVGFVGRLGFNYHF